MHDNDGRQSDVDQFEPGDSDSIHIRIAEEQYVLFADDETMPALFEHATDAVNTRAWIQHINDTLALRVEHEDNPVATWSDEDRWVATSSAPPPRGDSPASVPADFAYGMLSLGWDVTVRVGARRARVVVKPRFVKFGGVTERAWKALHVSPGSQIAFVWVRKSPQSDWDVAEAESHASGIDQAKVYVHASDAFLLALTIAPDWLMPPELDRTHWHSSGAPVAQTELPAESHSPLPRVGAEEIAKRKAALAEWVRIERMDGAFSDRAAVRAHLASHSPVGHYVLAFRDGGCYVGETANFDGRFAQHEKTYAGRIEAFYLRRDEVAAALPPRSRQRKRRLVEVERQMIHDAQNRRLHASNFREMANPVQPWPGFMELLDGAEQLKDWFAHPDASNRADSASFKTLSTNDFGGAEQKFLQYKRDPDATQVTRIIEAYLRRCVPFPARTELESWAISCLPNAKRGKKGPHKWSVIACLSISKTEALTILREDWSQRAVGFIAVNEVEAGTATEKGLIRLLRQHPGVGITVATHREFGPGTALLDAYDLDTFERLLDDTVITRAASTTALRLCRLGPSIQRAVHNPFLVDDALQTHRTWLP